MEKPIPRINFSAAFSMLTQWSDTPVTSFPNTCSLELPVAAPNDSKLRYICIGMLCKLGPLKFYKACQFANGQCPLNQHTPIRKIEDEPLEIEKKWAEIKARGE